MNNKDKYMIIVFVLLFKYPQTPTDGDSWLLNEIQEKNTKRNTGLRIPTYYDKKENKQAN